MEDEFKLLLGIYDCNDYSQKYANTKARLKTLIESKAKLNFEEKNSRGLAALHIAVLRSNYDLISCLLEAKADINVKDDFGRTPLHLAALTKLDDHYEGQKTAHLLKLKANPNAVDNNGRTPLHLAIQDHCTDWRIHRLLEAKANVLLKDNLGKTSFDLARDEGYAHKELYGPFFSYAKYELKQILERYITPAEQLGALVGASNPRLGAGSPAKILFAPPMGDRNVLQIIRLFLDKKENKHISKQPSKNLMI